MMNSFLNIHNALVSYYMASNKTKGPILIVLTTMSYALTSDATGVANATWLF